MWSRSVWLARATTQRNPILLLPFSILLANQRSCERQNDPRDFSCRVLSFIQKMEGTRTKIPRSFHEHSTVIDLHPLTRRVKRVVTTDRETFLRPLIPLTLSYRSTVQYDSVKGIPSGIYYPTEAENDARPLSLPPEKTTHYTCLHRGRYITDLSVHRTV